MKIQELRQKSKQELQELLLNYRSQLRDLRFQIAQRQLKNVRQVREVKKTISKILTLLNF